MSVLFYTESEGLQRFAEAAEKLPLHDFQKGIGGTETGTGRSGIDAADGAVDGAFSVVVAHMGVAVEEDLCSSGGRKCCFFVNISTTFTLFPT